MDKAKVRVVVRFHNEVDDNLEVYTLTAKIRYSIPDVMGFIKTREIEWKVLQDVTAKDWILHLSKNLTKSKIKAMVRNFVTEDIMNRLQKSHEKDEQEIMNQYLNMLNQINFDFEFDMCEAKQIVSDISNLFPKK